VTHENFFTISIRVYYEDTDFSGIVYHANHLKFFERGRTDALRACGVTHTDLLGRKEPLAFTITKMTTEWCAPARIDDILEVRTRFISVKGARMLLEQELRRGEDLVARADVAAACMALSGRPRRIPPDVAAKFSPGPSHMGD